MKTRSQTRKENNKDETVLYEVNIDFDEASSAWRSNKKYIGNGQYKYVCPQEKQDGSICKKVCYKGSEYCWSHRKKENK
jgi:hypothetical protein